MGKHLEALTGNHTAILLGEFGALLHMFGKASSEFLQANSREGGAQDSHQDLKHFPQLKPLLCDRRLKEKFRFKQDGSEQELAENFTDFITKYKGKDKGKDKKHPDSNLLRLFNTCHRMTSADEKGVVRRKQSINSMRIMTSFGRKTKRINPAEVDRQREGMDERLTQELSKYLNEELTIEKFREKVVEILEPGMSATLGETREPANDVTLWAQTFGVASLYKPCLAALALGEVPCPSGKWEYDEVQWRLFGIGWNGLAFLQRGRKPADILARQEVLSRIGERLRVLLEVEYPVGNLFYSDINGAFFTFPGITGVVPRDLLKELAPSLVGAVREKSADELWPFFTLSKPRRSLTVIAKEITRRNKIAAAPCVAPVLFEEGQTKILLTDGPELATPGRAEDICPVCRVRSKPEKKQTCNICEKRRAGRQKQWRQQPGGETIWVTEIADQNNRVALLTVRIDLSRWLNGEWLSTILSQTFRDWHTCSRLVNLFKDTEHGTRANALAPTPDAGTITQVLKQCVSSGDNAFRAKLLNTFFEDITVGKKGYPTHLRNLCGRIDDDPSYTLSAEDLARLIFTQNASPGRLSRMCEAADDFVQSLIKGLAEQVFAERPVRLRFQTPQPVTGVRARETYRVTMEGLVGGPVVVLCQDDSRSKFLTIDSLAKFRFRLNGQQLKGPEALEKALRQNGVRSWLHEETGDEVAGQMGIVEVAEEGSYLPYTVLAHSPVFSQILLPAASIPKVLELLLKLEEEHFGAVRGKLPLHVGVLAANRKFPLYALVEAGQQILDCPDAGKPRKQKAWWQASEQDDFFGLYPVGEPAKYGFCLEDLRKVQGTSEYWLSPGYFDFDFLGGTTDRHRLHYDPGPPPKRNSIAYGWLRPRPTELHELERALKIRELLLHVNPTQRHQIEALLLTKLQEWRTAADGRDEAFRGYARAVLKNALKNRREEVAQEQTDRLLRAAMDGLLLQTIQLFDHVLKEGTTK